MKEGARKFDAAKLAFVIFFGGRIFASKQLQPYQAFEDAFKATGRLFQEEGWYGHPFWSRNVTSAMA